MSLPRIFLRVEQTIEGHAFSSVIEIGLDTYERDRLAQAGIKSIMDIVFDAALAQINEERRTWKFSPR